MLYLYPRYNQTTPISRGGSRLWVHLVLGKFFAIAIVVLFEFCMQEIQGFKALLIDDPNPTQGQVRYEGGGHFIINT